MSRTTAPEVLLYHRIINATPDNQYLSVSPENFEAHLKILTDERKIVPLFDLIQAGLKGHLPERTVAITFDDGYADNLLHALPLLEKYRCHATIFVTAGMLGRPYGFWYDVLEDVLLNNKETPSSIYIPMLDTKFLLGSLKEIFSAHEILFDIFKKSSLHITRLLMHELINSLGLDPLTYSTPYPLLTEGQTTILSDSPWIEVGAHTLTHPILANLDETAQRREILGSVRKLQKITGKPIRILAYPYGNKTAYNSTTCQITHNAGLLGIANIQNSLSVPLDPQDIPRRLVRNWKSRQFHQWLRAADRSSLERETVGRRTTKILQHLENIHNNYKKSDIKRGDVPSTSHVLRITHINTMMGKGGTAGIAQLLYEFQKTSGHHSTVLTGHSFISQTGITTFDTAPNVRLENELRKEGLTDYHFQGSHMLHLSPQVQQAELLHFHNLHGGYFNPWSLAGLTRFRPSVWTLHDMHSLTGHCAHAFECARWKTGCGLCPNLEVYPATAVDNTHRLWRDKQRIYSCTPVQLVAPSRWLAKYIEQSILGDHPLEIIPNGIDTHRFTPQDKTAARARLGIAQETLVVGSAAYNGPLHNFWKGGSFALSALNVLRQEYPDVLFLGRGNQQEATISNVRLLPYTSNEEDMANFYAVLDFMIYPTLADNCPLVVLEAMACGIPVLAFKVGGIPELVIDGETGVLVPAQDGMALSQAALKLAAAPELRKRLGINARQRAEQEYDARLMAQRYEALYGKTITQWRTLPHHHRHLALNEIPLEVRTPAFLRLIQKTRLSKEDPILDSPLSENKNFRTTPLSRVFGLDRSGGIPIDRVYIERFLAENASCIQGNVLEVANNVYTKKFGTNITQSDILHSQVTPEATIVGNLATGENIPTNAYNCIILTQTIQFIYEIKKALKNTIEALVPGGILLLTASGISQISRYDMERWGEYWRFTDLSLKKLLYEVAPECNIDISVFGNVGTAKAFLDGLSSVELPSEAFNSNDKDYQVMLCAKVTKPSKEEKQISQNLNSNLWQDIVIPADIQDIYNYARTHRYGKYRVHFNSLTIYCIDLLSFYMAAKDIFLKGIYDFESKSSTPYVIDGGAHIGLFTLRTRQRYPTARILAFEPDIEARSLLERNLKANGLQKNIEIIPAGLYNIDGQLSFSSRGDDGNTLFGMNNNTTVHVTRLSRHLKHNIDFLKLNIEGSEWPVLNECSDFLGNVEKIIFEYHGFPELGDRLHLLLDLLHRHGFRYMLHDFDVFTNPASKPPFYLDAMTRYFLLVIAQKIHTNNQL